MAVKKFNLDEIKGASGVLSVNVGAGSDYKPLVCLMSTSISRATEEKSKVSYCTGGEVIEEVVQVNSTVTFDGIIVDTSGKTADVQGYNELRAIMYTKKEHKFKIEGRDNDKYFKAIISSLSDDFGEGEATFSGTFEVNGGFKATHAAL